MDRNQAQTPAVTDQVHPLIYAAIIGLCLWLIFSVWGFSGQGHTGLALTVVSLFIVVAVGIPLLLWRIARRNGVRRRPGDRPGLGDWLARDVEIWPGRLKGADVAVQILLPIAAVAFGMSTFALVLHLTV